MRVLLRYVLSELVVPLLVWLAFLFLLLFVMQFLRATEVFLGSAVTAGDLGRLLLYLGPHFVVMALPVAFLLAILLGMGRLGEDSEIVAMNSLGVGPLQILAIPVTLGVALGAVMLLMTSTFEPRGMSAVKGLLNEIIKKNVAGDVKPGVFYEDLSRFTVYVQDVDEHAGCGGTCCSTTIGIRSRRCWWWRTRARSIRPGRARRFSFRSSAVTSTVPRARPVITRCSPSRARTSTWASRIGSTARTDSALRRRR